MPEKVLDPLKQVTDPVLLKELQREGVDPEGVEFYQDYASRSLGKRHSPYAKFYRDLNSRKEWMVVSGLPMVDGDGVKIECGWRVAGINYFSEKNNLFRAKVQGIDVELIVRNDQPDGRKAGDRLSYKPQLYLNNLERTCGQSVLLPIDPVNSNYLENTLEWDYGICKRRLRIIQGHVLGCWVFASNPNGEVRIKYNQTGDYRLKLGQFATDNDTEVIPASVFATAIYPFTVSDSATYYPDTNSAGVDGVVATYHSGGTSWATLRGEGGSYNDYTSQTLTYIAEFQSDAVTPKFSNLGRGIFVIDESDLPNTAVLSAVSFSLYGQAKQDQANAGIDVNIYSSAPASNTALANGDFDSLGADPFATTISYANWKTADPFWNEFIFNAAGLAAAQAACTGNTVLKLGTRDATHDVGNSAPTWGGAYYESFFSCYASEKGAGYKPKLVVTYTVSVAYSESAAVLVGEKTLATRLANYPRPASVLVGELIGATRSWGVAVTSPVLVGILVSATKAWGQSISSAVLVGILVSASRVLTYTRASAILIGELVTASRILTYTRLSSVLSGIAVTASRAWGIAKTSSVAVGVAVSALRTLTYTRTSSVISGILVTATRVFNYQRTAPVLLGIVVTATRTTTYSRVSSVFSGILVTATRALTYTRASAVISGVLVSATRVYGRVRTASVIVGITVLGRLWTKIKRLVGTIGTNRTQSTVGTNRDVSTTGTNRDNEPW